ncbi:MAG: hypothetical protein MR449_05250 [Spirochaetia bacterium]|nr:hypothetical protein [Spirochaetia bacterium]
MEVLFLSSPDDSISTVMFSGKSPSSEETKGEKLWLMFCEVRNSETFSVSSLPVRDSEKI